MRGVYSSCVGADPLDESSVAYKSTDCIVKEKDIRNFGYLFFYAFGVLAASASATASRFSAGVSRGTSQPAEDK